MAIITPDSFNPLQRFVSVRLQQGVPIIDADWNEKEDARRFELRSHLKWYVGDGVPFGADAFRVQALAVPAANNLLIRAGTPAAPVGTGPFATGLRHVGRCLVDGMEATIEKDVAFRAQELHVAKADAALTASRQATVPIAEMKVFTGTLLVYLDVWERLARPDEFPGLVFTDIGTESCVRIRREWAVRTRDGTAVPDPASLDYEPGHSYYALASVARVAGDSVIYPNQITDLREQRLLTPPATLIEDMLGVAPDRYRRGLDRPVIPLRTVINALLRGQLPSSVDQVIAPDPMNDFPSRAIARVGADTYVVWHSNRAASINQVFAAGWPTSEPEAAGTNGPVQVTNGAAAEMPSLALLPTLPTPAFFVAYQTQGNIRYRRAATPAALAAAPEVAVASQPDPEGHPVAIRVGQIVTVFWHWNGPAASDRIRYRRLEYKADWAEGTATWLENDATDLSTLQARLPSTTPGILHAAADPAARIWVAFETNAGTIAVVRLTPGSGGVETFTDIQLSVAGQNLQPFVLADDPGRIWVFWRADGGIHQAAYDLATSAWGRPRRCPAPSGPPGPIAVPPPCATRRAASGCSGPAPKAARPTSGRRGATR